jgi:L,D-transpeptidase ErfK/SrfK
MTTMPPGPDNPLGKYWLGLSRRRYGIHGTNFPWGVGRLVSHGCIRLYPEHISQLYKEAPVGTRVEIINAPVKIGFKNGDIFLEVHTDPYGKTTDLVEEVKKRLQHWGIWEYISPMGVIKALRERNGVPFYIGSIPKGGDKAVVCRAVDVHCP